jgi:hypothetical protein
VLRLRLLFITLAHSFVHKKIQFRFRNQLLLGFFSGDYVYIVLLIQSRPSKIRALLFSFIQLIVSTKVTFVRVESWQFGMRFVVYLTLAMILTQSYTFIIHSVIYGTFSFLKLVQSLFFLLEVQILYFA